MQYLLIVHADGIQTPLFPDEDGNPDLRIAEASRDHFEITWNTPDWGWCVCGPSKAEVAFHLRTDDTLAGHSFELWVEEDAVCFEPVVAMCQAFGWSARDLDTGDAVDLPARLTKLRARGPGS